MKKIHDYLFKMKDYISYTIDSMDNYLDKTNHLVKYEPFNSDLQIHKTALTHLLKELELVTPFTISIHKIFEIGHVMHLFYQLYDNKEYSDSLLYSFGFNGYTNLLDGLKTNIDSFKLNKTTFLLKEDKKKKDKSNKNKKTIRKPAFKKMYYPKFIDNTDVITNDCKFNKNLIITGPNASGKTTVLKGAMINLILSQQIGFGCYESLEMHPYDMFHCYLNIPDTSGRDSLFQAEARRCKEIMECIKIKNTEDITHFCILDEIYSGTNPDEAVISANMFMKNIVKHDNVTCLLTTHYVKLCKKLAKNKRIINCQMNTKPNEKGTDFEYTYKLANGISTVKGGLKVLKDLQI
jgi:DNA mismatch repair ATPase MutS